jgi:hypothetical protein
MQNQRWCHHNLVRVRTGSRTILGDQTAGSESCPWRDTLVSTLAGQAIEICAAQGRTSPAFCARCVQ